MENEKNMEMEQEVLEADEILDSFEEEAENHDLQVYDLDEEIKSNDTSTAAAIGGLVLVGAAIGVGLTKGIGWLKRKHQERKELGEGQRHFICLGKKKQAKEDPEVDFGDENDESPE